MMTKTIQALYTPLASGQIDHTTVPTSNTCGVAPAQFASVALNMINASELAALQGLYTHYKVQRVTYTWNLNSEGFTGIVTGGTFIPRLMCRYNYDAEYAGAVTTSSFQQLGNYRTYSFNGEANVARYSWYPRMFITNYATVGTTSNIAVKPKWTDFDYVTTFYPGCQWAMPYAPAGATLTLEITIQFLVRNQK